MHRLLCLRTSWKSGSFPALAELPWGHCDIMRKLTFSLRRLWIGKPAIGTIPQVSCRSCSVSPNWRAWAILWRRFGTYGTMNSIFLQSNHWKRRSESARMNWICSRNGNGCWRRWLTSKRKSTKWKKSASNHFRPSPWPHIVPSFLPTKTWAVFAAR